MFKKLLKPKSQGFTLIEIVLVLAIAGLILVIVFLAVTGAQRAQRDTARKDYVNRLVASDINMVGNQGGGPQNCTQTPGPPDLLSAVVTGAAPAPANKGVTMTATTGAVSIDNVNVSYTAPTCTFNVLLENGGNYQRQATP